MRVRAKFYVEQVEQTDSEGGGDVHLNPVTGGSEENASFFRYTPGGYIILSTVNPEAIKAFEQGKEFYVDFTPADE